MHIYVETFIAGSMDDVWQKTQTPDMHERWDLRFSEIRYLPHPDASLPQQFLYKTRLGLGLEIAGTGETVGTRVNTSQRTSALKFASDDPKSLIRTGSGYWKYEQREGGIRFLTGYDYDTRFGSLGRLFDRFVFRPLIGWATAWSFDRLRLWIEKGIDPSVLLTNTVIHALARLSIVFIWLYQGLMPKLLFLQADEMALMAATRPPLDIALAVRIFGLIEVIFGLMLLVLWHKRWALLLNIPLMIAALLAVAFTMPDYLVGAFNPVTLNISVIMFSLIAYLCSANLPSARRCLRKEKTS